LDTGGDSERVRGGGVGGGVGRPAAAGTNLQGRHAGSVVVRHGGRRTEAPRADLTKEDFEVFDNEKPQALTYFDNSIHPITVVVMLDTSGSMT
jgi:hypothetical protein